VTELYFDVLVAGSLRLDIFDVRGRHVRLLADGVFAAGSHSVRWDGQSDGGLGVSSGVYFARLTLKGSNETSLVKLLLAK